MFVDSFAADNSTSERRQQDRELDLRDIWFNLPRFFVTLPPYYPKMYGWRDGRVVECVRLEIGCYESNRGFESPSLR